MAEKTKIDITGFFRRNNLCPAKVLVGFSGGADSTALLCMLNDASEKLGFKLSAVNFEHGIREKESVADSKWCKAFCAKRRIPFQSVPLAVPQNMFQGESVETAARRLRLQAWNRLTACPKDRKTLVALAHHADDRVENLILRLVRGSNASGLTSLRPVQKIDGITFIRPLLDIGKAKLETYLAAQGVKDWCIDRTNTNSATRRNFIRNEILPILYEGIPQAREGFLSAIAALEADADFIEAVAKNNFSDIREGKCLMADKIAAMHPAMLHRVLRLWLSENLGHDVVPDRNLVQRIMKESAARRSGQNRIAIPFRQDIVLILSGGLLSICDQADTAEIPETEWTWRDNMEIKIDGISLRAAITGTPNGKGLRSASSNVAYFNLAEMPDKLIVRSWRHGDTMVPFGSASARKLKKIFEDSKIPSHERSKIPVIATPGGKVIWVPVVRRSDFAPAKKGAPTLKIEMDD